MKQVPNLPFPRLQRFGPALVKAEEQMAVHPVLNTADSASSTAALLAKRLSLRPHVSLRARLTGAASGAGFSIACWLVAPVLTPLAAANEVVKERPLQHIAVSATPAKPAKQVAFQTVEKGSQSGVREFLAIIIRGQAEWQDLWQRHASIKANVSPAPTVDFDKEMVLGLFLGEKPTGGYEAEILSAERVAGTLLISFAEKGPPAGAILTQALTQPFHIVRVAINGTGAVGFRRVS